MKRWQVTSIDVDGTGTVSDLPYEPARVFRGILSKIYFFQKFHIEYYNINITNLLKVFLNFIFN